MIDGTTKLLILCAVALSALGQILLKSGARHLSGLGRLELALAAARDPHVLAAVATWGASTLCWLYVLRVAPLSRVYGVNSLTYVLVPLVSIYAFDERLRPLHVLGMTLILGGVVCVLSGD